MAKQRMIDTKIWEDDWFASLNQIEQLVFIYLLTNPMTNIIGCYELSRNTICNATRLNNKKLESILKKFSEFKKIYYIDGWVVLANFIKHQNYKSPTIQKGIEVELEKVPKTIKPLLKIPYLYGIDTLSHFNSNSNTNYNELKKDNIIKKEKYPFVEINWNCEYTKKNHHHGKYKLFMGKNKKVYGKCPENNQYILLSEIKKFY